MIVPPRIIKNAVVLVTLVILGLSIRSGYYAGRSVANTSNTIRGVYAVLTGLHYFYEDQSRYPSNTEFTSVTRMGVYLSNFPPRFFTDSLCTNNGVYQSSNLKVYSFRFCIPRSSPPFGIGLNT